MTTDPGRHTGPRGGDGDTRRLYAPRPVYLVACPISGDLSVPHRPVLYDFDAEADNRPGSFDHELMPALPAIWYALHLPKTRYEVLDLPLPTIRQTLSESRRHRIVLAPTTLLDDHALLAAVVSDGEPMLILTTEPHLPAAEAASAATGFVLLPVSTAELSQASLDRHWQTMSDYWHPFWPSGTELYPTAPEWTPTIPLQGSTLTYRRLRRALCRPPAPLDQSDDPFYSAFETLRLQTWIRALTELEDQGLTPDQGLTADQVDAELGRVFARTARTLQVPLSISLPGVAPRYRRMMRQVASGADRRSPTSPDRDAGAAADGTGTPDHDDPPDVFALMVAHQAAGDDSMAAAITEPIPDRAFVALANLERHWVEGAKPSKERALRARLDAAMRPFWTQSVVAAIHSATRIEAYTNFPIGLLRMPGHTAPLAALKPIAYRPINPLTRALQLQFTPDRIVDLSGGMKVLVVECIPPTDPVGELSRRAWSLATDALSDPARSVTVNVEDAMARAEFRAILARHRPDVLVISAHGFYAPDANVAGLVVGNEHSLGDDLGPMPPLVILSACHSGPRGAGPVAVADLLVRAGANAVLSTLVPVDVRHNATFMIRFLTYMSETIGGVEDDVDILALWARVQTNTVIIDIIHGNRKLHEWGYSEARGVPPIVQFMQDRSRGRLRPHHLYNDAETVLLEIAADRGEDAAVRGWLRNPGYLPESMMYTLVGDPSSIRLRPSSLVFARPPAPPPAADEEGDDSGGYPAHRTV